MKKRGGDVAVIIFLLIVIVLIVLFEFFYVYTAVLGHDLKISKITGWLIGDDGGEYTLITIYPEQEVGRVRDDFYGANVHDSYLKEGMRIDSDEDGIIDDLSNTTWHRENFLRGGYTYAREDMVLGSYYDGWYNGGAEDWNSTYISSLNYSSSELPFGWGFVTTNLGGGIGSQSIEKHSGFYSTNITSIGEGGVWSYKDTYFKAGSNYNFSVWIKSPNIISVQIQNKNNWYADCSTTSSGSGEWEQISCNYAPSTFISEGYRLIIMAGKGESALWDDANLTEDGISVTWWRKGDLGNKILEYEWAKENGIRILNIISYTPKFLADLSSGCWEDLDYNDCAPSDYDLMGKIVTDYVNRSTNNGQYLGIVDYEEWNEPDIYFWLDSLNDGNQKKAELYIKMHNATRTNLKNSYSNICIGGTSSANFWYNNITNAYLSNFSDDCFFSFHKYISPAKNDIYTSMQDLLNSVISKCSLYGANCSRIIISEYNLDHSISDDWIKNTSSRENEYGAYYGLFYISTLNSYPKNISMITYQWADPYKYNQTTKYPQYPHQWYSVQEPSMGLEYKPPYNVTKDFAHYHAGGNIIVNSSSSNKSVKVVASLNPEGVWHVTAIMVGAGYSNVSIDVGSSGIEALMDLKTGEVYNAVDGIVEVGAIEQYDVKHYESTTPKVVEPVQEELEEVELSEEEILIEGETNEINEDNTIQDEVTQDNETETINETIEITTKTSKKRSIFKTIFLWDTADSTNLDLIEEGVAENNLSEIENKTESLGEIIIDYITGASSTDDNYSKDKKHSSSGTSSSEETSKEGEALLTEGIESEVSDSTNTTYTLSQALSNNGYMSIIIILLVGIIIVGLIIKGIYKKKKHNADIIIKLNDWVKRAKALGYDYTKMKNLLEEKRWNKSLVEKALEDNGVQREPLY